mgnify:CR=1 FL=1
MTESPVADVPGRKLRIGIVCPYSFEAPGGVQFHIRDLAEALIAQGHEVGVLVAADDDTPLAPYMTSAGGAIPLRYNGKWVAQDCTAISSETGQGNPFPIYMYGLFMAEVAVDVTTGKTVVEKLTMIADVGRVVNRDIVDGQLYGGMIQGLGLALSEDFEDIPDRVIAARCRTFLERAYEDFVTSNPLKERVFKVLKDHDPSRPVKPGEAFVGLDEIMAPIPMKD